MHATRESEPMKNPTQIDRSSERELVITRTFNGPSHLVFKAWTAPELFTRWWIPKSYGISIVSYEMDIRTGGSYRLTLRRGTSDPMVFHGNYIEVTPSSRLVWTNEESPDGQVTTVTFEEKAGKTLVVVHELYPSKEALEANQGAEAGLPESFDQLDELLAGRS
jgi:uncharacterized protein YndB with AHSA1/START domain